MKTRSSWLLAILALSLMTGCDSILDVSPQDQLPADEAITDAASAQAALIGAYSNLTSTTYYGGTHLFVNDLAADNAVHTGTLSTYADIGSNMLRPDNGTIAGIWSVMYSGISRVNSLLEQLSAIENIPGATRDQILGEAHFLRALHYHNLVRLWGDVPLRTSTPAGVQEASQIERAPVADVYAQIVSDLETAEQLMGNTSQTRRASAAAAEALLARVHLYREDWSAAEAKADEVIARGFTLAPEYGDLFAPGGSDTPEDIFRVIFTASDYNNMGYYYMSRGSGGRGELGVDGRLLEVFEADDARRAWSVPGSEERSEVTKFPTTAGTEDIHVIRFAEVLLIRAEALAEQGDLEAAVATYNRVRERAGLDPHVLGEDVITAEDVLAAIAQERRVELAFEGDRWADLVRRGLAESVLDIPGHQTLLPIPQRELDVAPNLVQNPGY